MESVEQIRAIVREELAAQAEREAAEKERKAEQLKPDIDDLVAHMRSIDRRVTAVMGRLA